MTYQWYDNNSAAIAGATNTTLIVSNLQPTQAGTYSVTVTDPYGSASTNAALIVNSGAPVISTDLQPTNLTSYTGTIEALSVTVAGSEPLAYQWYLNNSPITDATNSSYTFATLAPNSSFATYAPVTTTSVTPVTLDFNASGGNLMLNWSQGTLQSADKVSGPYNDITGATPPYSVPITNSQEYFRIRVGP